MSASHPPEQELCQPSEVVGELLREINRIAREHALRSALSNQPVDRYAQVEALQAEQRSLHTALCRHLVAVRDLLTQMEANNRQIAALTGDR